MNFQQLTNFQVTIKRKFPNATDTIPPNWFMAFQKLIDELEKIDRPTKKVIFFDMMIDIAEQEFKIPIRKKSLPEQSINTKPNKKKR